jgi:hypothetical protein
MARRVEEVDKSKLSADQQSAELWSDRSPMSVKIIEVACKMK